VAAVTGAAGPTTSIKSVASLLIATMHVTGVGTAADRGATRACAIASFGGTVAFATAIVTLITGVGVVTGATESAANN